jgi:hypothetical protein
MFMLHPTIPSEQQNLHTADFATGPGIWLIDVSKIVDASCILDD